MASALLGGPAAGCGDAVDFAVNRVRKSDTAFEIAMEPRLANSPSTTGSEATQKLTLHPFPVLSEARCSLLQPFARNADVQDVLRLRSDEDY